MAGKNGARARGRCRRGARYARGKISRCASRCACGIFQPELDVIIPKIKQELQNIDIAVIYLSPGLHNTPEKMKEELIQNLDNLKSEKTLTLYGSGCHTEIATMLKEYNAVSPKEKNCIEMVLNPEIKAEKDKSGNIII
ncbi:MAG: DUF1638 domain-containing protein [Spirochaetaceae bacterium]|jgi:hypothetical protein|nr:DUF1638 domain-containing protein [Spirochaetaceae bacterium]